MNFTVNGTIGSFLLAVLVWFLFDIVINYLVTEPRANRVLHVILLIIVVVIALGGSLFIHA